MKTTINGKEYIFTNEIRNNSSVRYSFNELAKKTFGIDFEGWYQNGFWQDDYIPYVLMDGDTVVSNISINIMHVNVHNEKKLFIQLGTVMTDKNYRGLGLSRWLMEKIIAERIELCDAFYLFANDTVLDFYPKFGFVKRQEYQASVAAALKKAEVRKLDMDSLPDRKLLYEKYALSNPFSDLAVENNSGLLMFYCSQFMKENVYYLPEYEVAVIAEYDSNQLLCYDIFGRTDAALQDILSAMSVKDTHVSILGFTPKDKAAFSFKEEHEEDLTLFWMSRNEDIFTSDARLMFPLLSHA